MTFGSLFSGVGGMDLGLERAGWECAWQCEIDSFATRVLAKHWPNVRRWDDVRTFPPKHGEWGVDLIAGGFPCQPVSDAGLRKAQADDRWLWPEFARILRCLRPRYALLENTPGLLSRGLHEVLGDLAASGFDAEWQMLPASMFSPYSTRERVFILAYPCGLGLPTGLQVLTTTERRPMAIEKKRPPEGKIRQPNFAGRIGRSGRPLPDTAFERIPDGFPSKLDADRIRGIGNAVHPDVAEWIGRRILEAAQEINP